MYPRLDNSNLPEFISCSMMARLLNLSRSRFYMLISPHEGIFLPPIYNVVTKRPFYTREMAQVNLAAKKRNQGVNGKICMFYSARTTAVKPLVEKSKEKESRTAISEYDEIKSDLESLGLKGISSSQIRKAIDDCFPDGTDGVDEGDIVRKVFLSIKRAGL